MLQVRLSNIELIGWHSFWASIISVAGKSPQDAEIRSSATRVTIGGVPVVENGEIRLEAQPYLDRISSGLKDVTRRRGGGRWQHQLAERRNAGLGPERRLGKPIASRETSIWQVGGLGIQHSPVSRSPDGNLLTVAGSSAPPRSIREGVFASSRKLGRNI
ncbi:uncharacterized protein LY79DRAFT_115948 [Colletotrichum navitas]|uniref:Uncharacterized protein n=1 Tax=Colletotrichum navitas TaxID=681940 RepID=A0AAD8Q4F1_9PEZI|nr:uncharacterized protein LY79DRAFT_115948 [Colletotrichum navitas]KAK1595016.1 hypothetical protein LY79DRAFT_115948 [Colletotrichum navitas]